MPNTFNNPYLNNVPFNTFPQTYPNQFNQTTNPYMNNNQAMNTAAINQNTTAQTQKILDAIQGNRMADMQNQINQLQLQNAVAGVVRYPMSTAYNAGYNPFCGCNCASA